jgi:hypothetical protein
MLVKIKLKNSDKSVIVDDLVYEYLINNPFLKSVDFINNLREHATTHNAVFQKWWNLGNKQSRIETIYLNRLVAEKFITRPETDKKLRVNFINGDKLDCRLGNLEWCTYSTMARKCKIANKTGYRGVFKDRNQYIAVIYVNGQRIKLGRFANKEEAAEAYNKKSEELFGIVPKVKKLRNKFIDN